MYFLATSICDMPQLGPVWDVVGFIVKSIWFGVPVLLIIFGMIDLGKAVIASKEDEVKKATKAFGKRFLYAVLVFLVVWIVQVVMDFVAGFGFTDTDGSKIDTSGWKACWAQIRD